MTTVYHGTGVCSLDAILTGKAAVKRRHYLPMPAFSVTTDLAVAKLFAVRKTTADEFMKGKITGVVIEFELDGVTGKDYKPTRDPFCMLEEHEVAVFDVRKLTPVATWANTNGKWERSVVQ